MATDNVSLHVHKSRFSLFAGIHSYTSQRRSVRLNQCLGPCRCERDYVLLRRPVFSAVLAGVGWLTIGATRA